MSDGVIRRARDHYFVIGGRPSSDFGIVCSSDNGFDAPARDVETISVQGRNGDLHIDKGRWENVSVTYTCTIERDFVRKFGEFRKFISSLRGYQRLEDTFHPGEYRMASLNGGIEVDQLGTRYNSGKFDLTFNCKPQRFLKSGEGSISIPCDPAASPASARRYWRLSQFPSETQEALQTGLLDIGYTQAEITAMQFDVITATDDPSEWTDIRPMNLLEFKGYDPDRFFAFAYYYNPFDESATGSYAVYTEPIIGITPYWCADYYIIKKVFGSEVWYANRMIGQDSTYQTAHIVNPTRYDAIPKFRIKLPSTLENLAGATVYMVGVGQSGIALKWTEEMSAYVDCVVTFDAELSEAYILPEDNYANGLAVNLNAATKFYGERITLKSGDNIVKLDPMIVSCEIVPRWWTI